MAYHDLQYAKHLALSQRQTVILCPSSNMLTCSPHGKYFLMLSKDGRVIHVTTLKQNLLLKASLNAHQITITPKGRFLQAGSLSMGGTEKIVFTYSGHVHMHSHTS